MNPVETDRSTRAGPGCLGCRRIRPGKILTRIVARVRAAITERAGQWAAG